MDHTTLLNEIARSNAIYNLSGADDDQNYHYEPEVNESEGGETDNDEQDDSDHSTDNDDEHIPTAPWFRTEEINDNLGNCSNVNSLDDELFEGQCFTDKQAAVSAIKENHIKSSRNYHVTKSDTTRYEAKCVVEDCPWRIRVMKSKRSGLFVTTKLPTKHNCFFRTLQRDHQQLSSRMIANVIKQQITESPYLKVNIIQSQITAIHAGIIEAMKREESGFTGEWGIHRFCLLHVRSNFCSAFPGAHLKMLCWVAGNTSQLRKFEAAMEQIKELNPDAERWLRKIPLEMWTMSHDGGCRYGQATTNMIESFNGLLRSARFLPVTAMVEYIYYRSVKLVAQRRTQTLEDLQNGQTYCKKSRKLFEIIEQKASAHRVISYNQQRRVFEVITAQYRTKNGSWKGGNRHNVDVSRGFCSCGKCSRYHFPCSHIVAGCLACNLNWQHYIEPYHNLSTLCDMWKYEFNPIPNQAYWTFPLANNWEMYGFLIADEGMRRVKKKRGQRGQSSRIRTEMDNPRKVIVCGRCGQEGHTRRNSRCPQYDH
ncbi:uncharacterized protein LOC141718197 [Apium graveolens]|uniref:uncharacterized protein LOC141718197 n=1 Tax=Apium graveolens TaxID=4045 RepID=UPI003D79A570